jgi:hypothetical protein
VSGSARVDGDASESTGKGLLDGDMPLRYALKILRAVVAERDGKADKPRI